ncbi:MAG: glycogen synthase GlgA [Lachnospiraceae bacterium]|nr:glycogen synthase GlgA [Lachnospiraceae bacterium]
MKKILFAASECVPFIKTGGLADVVGALPKEFDKDEWDVRVILPNYRAIPDKFRNNFKYITHFYMGTGPLLPHAHVGIMQYEYEGITYYFIDNLDYFGADKPYSDVRTDVERFIFFSKAALSVLPIIDFKPDLIHCHDWQTGLIPVYLKTEFQANPFYWGIKTIMTIHNLRFQGVWDIKTIKGISGLPDSLFTPDKLEFNKDANLLKGGIVYADYVTTVSETYAKEIQTDYYGEGLNGLLHARDQSLFGIVNGVDYSVYDPKTDENVYQNYGIRDYKRGKEANKTALQKELGLEVNPDRYMIGLISRLTDQKGLDLVQYAMERLVDEFTQIVVIGTGEEKYENMFRYYASRYPDRVSANILYSDNLAHKLYAAADSFLMPSLFEPCGLTQIIALHYGTIPIVRETGGLKDTVIPLNEFEDTGDGFSFTNYNGDDMINTVNYSKYIFFEQKKVWGNMVKRAMKKDLSWHVSKQRYEDLYNKLIGR